MLSDEPIWLHDLVLEHDYRFLANLFTTLFVGKFAHMVLPPGIDGNGMLKLQFHDLTELFKAQESSARADAEGMAFVAGMQGQRSESRYVNMGRDLYLSLRRTIQDINNRRLRDQQKPIVY